MKIVLNLQFLTCKKYSEHRSTVKNCNFSKLQFFKCTSTVIPLHIFAVQNCVKRGGELRNNHEMVEAWSFFSKQNPHPRKQSKRTSPMLFTRNKVLEQYTLMPYLISPIFCLLCYNLKQKTRWKGEKYITVQCGAQLFTRVSTQLPFWGWQNGVFGYHYGGFCLILYNNYDILSLKFNSILQ